MADGPLTNFANLRVRTDANGYLLVTIGGGAITPTTVKTNSVTMDLANLDVWMRRSATKALFFDADGAGANLNSITFASLDATFNGSVHIAAAANFYWAGRVLFGSSADGLLQMGPFAGTTGVTADASTNGTLFLKTFANADAAIMKASAFNVSAGGVLIASSAAFSNIAAAQVATMTNGPTAGNPTKWIPINDNGTTRNIPAW